MIEGVRNEGVGIFEGANWLVLVKNLREKLAVQYLLKNMHFNNERDEANTTLPLPLKSWPFKNRHSE